MSNRIATHFPRNLGHSRESSFGTLGITVAGQSAWAATMFKQVFNLERLREGLAGTPVTHRLFGHGRTVRTLPICAEILLGRF